MRAKVLISILAGSFILLSAFAVLNWPADATNLSFPPASVSAPKNSGELVNFYFDFGNGKIISAPVVFKNGEKLEDALLRTNLKIKTEKYPLLGAMITSVNGYKNGKDKKYWQYFINGRYAEEGISSYALKPGDKIEWKFIE